MSGHGDAAPGDKLLVDLVEKSPREVKYAALLAAWIKAKSRAITHILTDASGWMALQRQEASIRVQMLEEDLRAKVAAREREAARADAELELAKQKGALHVAAQLSDANLKVVQQMSATIAQLPSEAQPRAYAALLELERVLLLGEAKGVTLLDIVAVGAEVAPPHAGDASAQIGGAVPQLSAGEQPKP